MTLFNWLVLGLLIGFCVIPMLRMRKRRSSERSEKSGAGSEKNS